MIHKPKPTTHPSIATATWTLVTAVDGVDRRSLCIANEDQSNVYRFEMVASGESIPTLATQGRPLGYGVAGSAGGTYEESDERTTGACYVYQASGGTLATLAVTEGV